MDNGSGQSQLTREQQKVAEMIHEARKLLRAGAPPGLWKEWKFQCNIRSVSKCVDLTECAIHLNRAEDALRRVSPYCIALSIPTEPTQ